MTVLNINAKATETKTTVLGLEFNQIHRPQLLTLAKTISDTIAVVEESNQKLNSEKQASLIVSLKSDLNGVVKLFDKEDDKLFQDTQYYVFDRLDVSKSVFSKNEYIYGALKSEVTTKLLLDTAKNVMVEIEELTTMDHLNSKHLQERKAKLTAWKIDLVRLYDTMHEELKNKANNA